MKITIVVLLVITLLVILPAIGFWLQRQDSKKSPRRYEFKPRDRQQGRERKTP